VSLLLIVMTKHTVRPAALMHHPHESIRSFLN
jgi:hypothetical protein